MVVRRLGWRRAAVALLLVLAAAAWVVLLRDASRNLYVEPTDAAVARASGARPAGIVASVALIVLVAAAAALSGRRWVAVMALPGVLAGGWLLLAPSSHGAALMYALAGSLVAVAVAAVAGSRSLRGGRSRV